MLLRWHFFPTLCLLYFEESYYIHIVLVFYPIIFGFVRSLRIVVLSFVAKVRCDILTTAITICIPHPVTTSHNYALVLIWDDDTGVLRIWLHQGQEWWWGKSDWIDKRPHGCMRKSGCWSQAGPGLRDEDNDEGKANDKKETTWSLAYETIFNRCWRSACLAGSETKTMISAVMDSNVVIRYSTLWTYKMTLTSKFWTLLIGWVRDGNDDDEHEADR